MSSLDLGIIGNCGFGALIDKQARIVWCCLPRFDGDPIFNALLRSPEEDGADGAFAITLDDLKDSEQFYEPNTAVLKTRLHGSSGSIEITDCVPRFPWRGRMFRPQSIVRRITPISGRPRLKIQLRPQFAYGAVAPVLTHGSNHIRYVGPNAVLRLTT
ncbi:MAG: glycoside hydrolase family 15 protein, partial [Alphaproteobacteria bacterium]|nr:glycoside hydrolase family 15 protein [Alphaproteobacteria bacterium]